MNRPRSSILLDLVATAKKLGEWERLQDQAEANLKWLDLRVDGFEPYLKAADRAIRQGRGVRNASLDRAKLYRDRDEVRLLRKTATRELKEYRRRTNNLQAQTDKTVRRLDHLLTRLC